MRVRDLDAGHDYERYMQRSGMGCQNLERSSLSLTCFNIMI